jgi:hypothetical protein
MSSTPISLLSYDSSLNGVLLKLDGDYSSLAAALAPLDCLNTFAAEGDDS